MHKCFILCIEYESNELEPLFSVKEFQSKSNTPIKQVFPAVAHKCHQFFPLYLHNWQPLSKANNLFYILQKSASFIFYASETNSLYKNITLQ